MAKSSKIVVSARTEAQFRKLYGYRNKSLQAYINALRKDRDMYYQHFLDTTTQAASNDVEIGVFTKEAA